MSILAAFQESISLREGHGPHDIKGKILQPIAQIERRLRATEAVIQLLKQDVQNLVDKRLVLQGV